MSSSMSNRNKANNQRTKRQALPNSKNVKSINTNLSKSIFGPTSNSYTTNYNTRNDYRVQDNNYKFVKPASFGLFNYLESPFAAKKLNDSNARKYRQKALKQQQYWSYQNCRNRQPIQQLLSGSSFFNPSPVKSPNPDYNPNYGYVDQVIPPTQDALDEYNRAPLDMTDIPPPSTFQQTYPNDNIETIFTHKPTPNYIGLSTEEARQALVRHVSNNYCLSKSLAKKMHILNIENSFIYSISLETFSEKRQTSWCYEPYAGGYIDNPVNGATPPVWDIVPLYDNVKPFRDHVETMVIPHTETIRSCFCCKSTGKVKCGGCHGLGYDRCYAITHKIDNGEPCFQCENGRKKCFNCNGYGAVNCSVCLGSGQLKCFLKLTITWKNHIDEYTADSIIPKDKLRFVSGDIIYNDTNVKVTPISYLTNRDLSKASERLISKHEAEYLTQERLIMQRQLIQVIQVSAVHYQYRNKLGIFYVFGKEFEKKVFAPNYPKSFFSCCTII